MPRIAVDAVLLPDENMTGVSVEISKILSKSFSSKILLDKENCLPHISLAMGVIGETSLPDAGKILKDVARDFAALRLSADAYRTHELPDSSIISEFAVKKTPELQQLHEKILEKISPLLSYKVSLGAILSPPPVDEITVNWIKTYRNRSSFEKFNPHITLGFGELDKIKLPILFTARKLAVCHLGNYCTCRKILFSTDLNPR